MCAIFGSPLFYFHENLQVPVQCIFDDTVPAISFFLIANYFSHNFNPS